MTRGILQLLLLCSSVCIAGISFGSEIRIDTHLDPLTGDVDVIMLPSGRFVVVWEGGELPCQDLKVVCSYSDDFGATWNWNIQVSDEDASIPQFTRLVCDSSGTLYAVWEDWRGPEPYAVYFSKSVDGGENWLWPNVRISNEGQTGLGPGIAVNNDGSVLVSVFVRFSDLRIYSSYSTNGGYTWSADTPVGDFIAEAQYYPEVEWVGGETFTAIWKDERDTETYVYCSVSEDNGQSWLQPNLPVPCGESQDLLIKSIDLFWDGSVLHSFWIEVVNEVIDNVYYSRSEDNGFTWLDDPVQVNYNTPNTKRRYGGIWARNSQEIYAVWCSIYDLSYPIYAVCAVSTDSGQTWSDTLRANPNSGEADRCDIFGNVASGEVILAWSNQVNGYIMCSRGYDTSGFEHETSSPNIQASRNPFTESVSFTVSSTVLPEVLTVLNTAGRRVETLNSFAPGNFIWTPSPSVVPGVYFVRGTTEEISFTSKVILLK